MENNLKRKIPQGFKAFQNSNYYQTIKAKKVPEVLASNKIKEVSNIKEIVEKLQLKDGMTFSFHHHLRNGDHVLNNVLAEVFKKPLKNITIAASSLFPVHEPLVKYIKNGQVTKLYTNYLNGPVAETVMNGDLKELLVMQTHGGRPRAIEAGEIVIDVAFIAASCVDKLGNASGKYGKNAFGSIGYAIADANYAKKVVLVTDNLVEEHPSDYDIDGKYVDYIALMDEIGIQQEIVSGTTQITRDPVGLKIAKDAAKVLDKLKLIKDGFSMQTGAGGVSLAVANEISMIMEERTITGSFVSGGITGYFVNMLKNQLVEKLYDVQCFDLWAVYSAENNANHHLISASKYANPFHEDPVVNKLDFAILGATEIDLDFNVNVTTDSYGNIIGGSGGHADVANGCGVTVIVTQLVKTRIPIIKERVKTITTPGEDVDILVTERGIAINPKRVDLIEKLKETSIVIKTIEQLRDEAHRLTGIPREIPHSDEIIGVVEYRDGTVIDSLYKPLRMKK